jgi:hypothetical protein
MVERAVVDDLVDEALCSQLASPSSVLAALARAGRRGRRGIGSLLGALEAWSPTIVPGSPAEVRLLRRLVELGLDPHDLVPQYELRDENGVLVARFDVGLPRYLAALEYDTDRWHGPRRFAADEARHDAAVREAWRVFHVAKPDLLPSSTRLAEVVALVRSPRGSTSGARKAG